MNQDIFQNQEQNEPVFFDAPVKKNAKYYRATARTRLSKIWGITILVTLLALLLGGIDDGGGFSFNFEIDLSGTAETEEVPVENVSTLTEEELALIGAFVVFFAIAAVLSTIAFNVFVASPVKLGYRRFLLEVVDENASGIRVATLFGYFKKGGYFKSIRLNVLYSLISFAAAIPSLVSLGAGVFMVVNDYTVAELAEYELIDLFIALLPAIAVIGAGILISALLKLLVEYVYGFSFFIMADCPAAGAIEALRSSRTLMRGNKWKLFCLDFSFIGWELLANFFTCGIGRLFLEPYKYTARALFYSDLAQRDKAKEVEFPSIDPDAGEAADAPDAPVPTFTEESPAQENDTADGINPESLESIEFPSLDLDDEKKDE